MPNTHITTSYAFTATTTPQKLVDQDGSRQYFCVVNYGPDTVYINFGTVAGNATTANSIRLQANEWYAPPDIGRGQINIFSASTDQDVVYIIA